MPEENSTLRTRITRLVPKNTANTVSALLRGVRLATARVPKKARGFDPGAGVVLYGFGGQSIGLSQGMRSYAHLLEATGSRYSIADVDFSFRLSFQDADMARARGGLNLVHLNPNEGISLFCRTDRALWDGRYNIAVWLWELECVPAYWAKVSRLYNEIWVPSEFIAKALRQRIDKPIFVVPYAVEAEEMHGLSRAKLGIPQDAFVALVMYDSRSSVKRKNPAGAIEAFKKALADKEDAWLLIKASHLDKAEKAELSRQCAGLARVRILCDILPRQEVEALIAMSSALIHLHRGEGFGLVMAEAMALGVPVVATAYSANMEFMDQDCALLVDYVLTDVGRAYADAPFGARWAQPDADMAARRLLWLYENPALVRALGERAKNSISEKLSVEKCAAIMRRRLDAIAKMNEDKPFGEN